MLHYNKVPLELVNTDLVMAPVDETAKAVVKLLEIKENKIYNLFSDNSLSMIKYMKAMTIPDIISLKDFANLLRKDSETNNEANFVLMYISGILNNPTKSIVTLQNYETNNILNSLDFKWSELDEKYVSSIKTLF